MLNTSPIVDVHGMIAKMMADDPEGIAGIGYWRLRGGLIVGHV
jgi:hypothetical protein